MNQAQIDALKVSVASLSSRAAALVPDGAPPPPPPSSGTPTWRVGMAALTWAKIGATVPADIDPEKNSAINPNYPANAPWHANGGFLQLINAWGGGALNGHKLRIRGGGHDDYAGNESLDCDLLLDNPSWTLFSKPTGCIGNTGNLDKTQVAFPYSYFDGTPRSSHIYNNIVFVGDELYEISGAVYGSGNSPHRMFKQKADGTWQDMGQVPTWLSTYGGLDYDKHRNQLIFSSDGNAPLQIYNVATGVWSSAVAWNQNSGRQRLICIQNADPTKDFVIILGQNHPNKFRVWDYGRTPGNVVAPPCTGAPSQSQGGGVFVPSLGANGSIVTWSGGSGFDVLAIPAGNPMTAQWAWTRLEATSGNAVTPDAATVNGILGRLFYDAAYNVLGLITAVDKKINVFALG